MAKIGQTAKNMIGAGEDTNIPDPGIDPRPYVEGQAGNQNPVGASNLRSQYDTNDNTTSTFGSNSKLTSGSGIGTTGHGDSNMGAKSRMSNKEFVSAMGGTTRGVSDMDRSSMGTGATGAAAGSQHHRRASDLGGTGFGGGMGMGSSLAADHTMGHRAEHLTMPTESTTKDSQQLHPVTHENLREADEVSRETEHVHQQPVWDKNIQGEARHDKIHPVPNENGNRERVVVDKGETVNEREHHHVHHVVQPIINKETIERHRIHTTIPIHQVTHEAPIVHKTQIHAPVSMEHFAQRGGQISGGLTHDQVGSTVLRSGECTREVDGDAERIHRELTGSNMPDMHTGSGIHNSGTGMRSSMTGTNNTSSMGKRGEGIKFADNSQGRSAETDGGRGNANGRDNGMLTDPRNVGSGMGMMNSGTGASKVDGMGTTKRMSTSD